VFAFRGLPTIRDCTFTANCATSGSEAGGAICDASNRMCLRDCLFDANWTPGCGGALVASAEYSVILDCVFQNNAASMGGAVYGQATCRIVNCLFRANGTTNGSGGAIFGAWDFPAVVNSTFIANRASYGGAMYYYWEAPPSRPVSRWREGPPPPGPMTGCGDGFSVTNCIVWDNDSPQIYLTLPFVMISYNDIEGGWYDGVGNIDADPLFVDPVNGDFRLQVDSPCIDAGANNALGADALDLDEDGDTIERTPLDFAGNPRFTDAGANDDTGCGAPVVVDMGLYEIQGDAWNPMRIGDCDGDGDVDAADLLALLAAWGEYDEGCVPGDLDHNGRVDADDLEALLMNWG
jgi:hypothetical protein